jgi:EAL domain-containing protein (putative c-di-GMP-specific phosphodiesterase class I)
MKMDQLMTMMTARHDSLDEETRLQILAELAILDTPNEAEFDALTRLVGLVTGCKIALISLVDRDRQWFKSRHGLSATETAREDAFCAHAIRENGMMVVPDARLDSRFRANPLVTGYPKIVFYAGVPLMVGVEAMSAPSKAAIGTLCAIHDAPHKLSPAQMAALFDLARLAEVMIERHASKQKLAAPAGQSEHIRQLDLKRRQFRQAKREPMQTSGDAVVRRTTGRGAILAGGHLGAQSVRQHADSALYRAKETGTGGAERHTSVLETNITKRLGTREIDAALREDRIEAYYQPLVRLDTREIVGLEALCRLRLGDSIVAAADFKDALEDAHVAGALTERMMTLVAADVRTWLDMGIPFQHVGVNVSSVDMHSGTLEAVLTAAFERQNVPLKHVIIEVTETVYMGDEDLAVQKAVKSLRDKGFRVALDDFGTGYASLTHLLTVPADIIKIDKSFVDFLAPGDASMIIVEGLLQIAKNLDIRVIAEGVETEYQAELLEAAGCTFGQGYLFSRAVDRHATTKLLVERAQLLDTPRVSNTVFRGKRSRSAFH